MKDLIVIFPLQMVTSPNYKVQPALVAQSAQSKVRNCSAEPPGPHYIKHLALDELMQRGTLKWLYIQLYMAVNNQNDCIYTDTPHLFFIL